VGSSAADSTFTTIGNSHADRSAIAAMSPRTW
jgi:hypothetical protein